MNRERIRTVVYGLLASALLICFLYGVIPNVRASNTSIDQNDLLVQTEKETLFDSRGELLARLYSASEYEKSAIIEELGVIDSELQDLGVTFLNSQDLQRFFIDHSGMTSEEFLSRIVIPSSTYNDWMLSQGQYTVNGVQYDVIQLLASPKPQYLSQSHLGYDTQKVASFSNAQWTAGTANIVRATSENWLGVGLQSVQGTIYNAIHSYAPDVTPTTLVSTWQINYRLSGAVTASFQYVRESQNSSWDEGTLTLVSTKAYSTVNYTTQAFSYRDVDLTWHPACSGVSGNKYYNAMPTNYNSPYEAIAIYNSVSYSTKYYTVRRLKVFNPNNANEITENLLEPAVPWDCEL